MRLLLVILNSFIWLSHASQFRRLGIVTGGTRGIGRGISERLAAWLDVLVLTYNTSNERAEQVAKELTDRYGIMVALVAGDLSEEATRDAVFACVDGFINDEDGIPCHLQVMVHNAGQVCGAICAAEGQFFFSCHP